MNIKLINFRILFSCAFSSWKREKNNIFKTSIYDLNRKIVARVYFQNENILLHWNQKKDRIEEFKYKVNESNYLDKLIEIVEDSLLIYLEEEEKEEFKKTINLEFDLVYKILKKGEENEFI
jgi:hypothetical protein